VPPFTFGVDVREVDDLTLMDRRRRQEHHKVVALLRGDFRHGARRNEIEIDVVDNHFGIVLLAPFLDVDGIEPFVVARNEMVPLHDLESLGGARGIDVKKRTGARRKTGACGIAAPESVFRSLHSYSESIPQLLHANIRRTGVADNC
jgi:hypothetical protein